MKPNERPRNSGSIDILLQPRVVFWLLSGCWCIYCSTCVVITLSGPTVGRSEVTCAGTVDMARQRGQRTSRYMAYPCQRIIEGTYCKGYDSAFRSPLVSYRANWRGRPVRALTFAIRALRF